MAEDNRFINCEPVRDSVSVTLEDDFCIRSEVVDNLLAQPAAVGILEVKGDVPMVERDHWLDVVLDTSIDHVVVMREAQFIDLPFSKWEDSRPRDREGVIWYPESSDSCNICFLC